VDALHSYLERKSRELAVLDQCLRAPIRPARPESVAAAIEQKLALRARLKADQLLECGSITETARPPGQWTNAGPFSFRFGYQRADLDVRGPSIYPELRRLHAVSHESTVYTGSGMGAIAALLSGLLQLDDTIEVLTPDDCYGETRELMVSFGPRIRVEPLIRYPCGRPMKPRVHASSGWIRRYAARSLRGPPRLPGI
jgi:hypothetical protein